MFRDVLPRVAGDSTGPALMLLRPGAVGAHRWNVPLTREGRAKAVLAGRRVDMVSQGGRQCRK